MDLGLGGATAVVTGGSKGMGRAIAERLAAEGARVAVLARGRRALDETVDALHRPGATDRWGSPSTSPTTGGRGGLRRAGRALGVAQRARQHPRARSRPVRAAGRRRLGGHLLDSALMAAVRCRAGRPFPFCAAAEWARIVNFSAHSTQRQSPLLVAYTASKAAVTSFSKNLSKSLAPEGILVNTVSPGSIVTASFSEGLRAVFDEEGLDATDPYDVMRLDRPALPPAGRPGSGRPVPRRWPRWWPTWPRGPTAT